MVGHWRSSELGGDALLCRLQAFRHRDEMGSPWVRTNGAINGKWAFVP